MSSQFMNEDIVKREFSVMAFFRRMLPYLKRHKLLTISVILIVIGQSITSRLLPSVIGWTVDHGFMKKDIDFVTKMAFLYLALEVLKSGLNFLNIFLFQKLGNRVLFYLREDLTKHILKLPVQFFNQTPTGRIVTRMTNDISTLGELFSDGVVSIVTNTVMLLAIVIFMGMISIKLTLATLLLTPFFILVSFRLGDKIKAILSESKKKLATLNSFVAENLNGIKIVQLYGREPRHADRFKELSTDYKENTLKSIHYYALLYPVMNLFGSVTIAVTLIYGGFLRLDNALEVGALIAFFLHVQDFIHPLREIIEKFQQFQNSLTSADRIFSLLDETEEDYSGDQINSSDISGEIEVKNLNFGYTSDSLVLKNLNLKIENGLKVALVGRTGSGKSTFIALLQRFYEAPENSIFLGGQSIHSIHKTELRRFVSSVQQDPFLFKGSIRENICLDDRTISEEKIEFAASQVGLQEILAKSNRDLSSQVEERGANLSLGEKQLISFARILAFDPQILILDEATANVDSETERIIQAATEAVTKGRTSLIIAHRLSTIENSDLILVLKDGEIIEQGTHAELLAMKGYYFKMHESGPEVDNHLVSDGV